MRGNRSAITPPNSRKSTIGTVRAARTWPSALAEPVRSSTAKVRAIPAIIEPSVLLNREAKYQAKLRSRSGATASRHVIAGGSVISNEAAVRLTCTVPGVRGGRASACTRVEASSTRALTRSQTSGVTQSSASVIRIRVPGLRCRERRTSSSAMART